MYITAIEDLDTHILESLDAMGCTPFQKIRYGVIPQLTASFISTTIYRFDINLKDATTLGIVGAGGIGASLVQCLNSRRWAMVGSFVWGLMVLVLIIGQVVFSGVMFSMTGALTAISYIIVCRWGMGALGASTDLNDRLSWLKAGLDSPMYDATVPNLVHSWQMLGLITLVCVAAAWLVLYIGFNRKKG